MTSRTQDPRTPSPPSQVLAEILELLRVMQKRWNDAMKPERGTHG